MDSNTTVTLGRIRNSGSYLQAHYDGPYHRGVAQLTLDDTGRIHVRHEYSPLRTHVFVYNTHKDVKHNSLDILEN